MAQAGLNIQVIHFKKFGFLPINSVFCWLLIYINEHPVLHKSTTEQTGIKRCDVEEGYGTQKWMNPQMLSAPGQYIQRHSRT